MADGRWYSGMLTDAFFFARPMQMTTAGASDSRQPSVDFQCSAVHDTRLRCSIDGGMRVWRGVHNAAADIPASHCPTESIPWRAQAVCDNTGNTQCFKSRSHASDNVDIAVCVVPNGQGEVRPTAIGRMALDHSMEISYDRRVDEAELGKDFDMCFVSPYKDLTNAAFTIKVPKGEKKLCDRLVSDAVQTCMAAGKSQRECESEIHHTFAAADHKDYRCSLDTDSLPIGNDTDKRWWRWTRHNQYPCRGSGWKCADASLSEYEGGDRCKKDTDCDAPSEMGVCYKNACVAGETKAESCTRHEDCDITTAVTGKCGANGRCTSGRSGIGVSYYAPRECDPVTRDESLHAYCGRRETENGGVAYTGVCSSFDYDGKTFHGCRAFKDKTEILQTVSEELDHQAKFERGGKNMTGILAWQLIEMCPPEDMSTVGGVPVCLHTTRTLPAHRKVVASDAQDATDKCHNSVCTADSCPVGLCTRAGDGECRPVEKTQRSSTEHAEEWGARGISYEDARR